MIGAVIFRYWRHQLEFWSLATIDWVSHRAEVKITLQMVQYCSANLPNENNTPGGVKRHA